MHARNTIARVFSERNSSRCVRSSRIVAIREPLSDDAKRSVIRAAPRCSSYGQVWHNPKRCYRGCELHRLAPMTEELIPVRDAKGRLSTRSFLRACERFQTNEFACARAEAVRLRPVYRMCRRQKGRVMANRFWGWWHRHVGQCLDGALVNVKRRFSRRLCAAADRHRRIRLQLGWRDHHGHCAACREGDDENRLRGHPCACRAAFLSAHERPTRYRDHAPVECD
jgi:hypothetical protein